MVRDERIGAFNAAKAKCSVCAAPLAFTHYDHLEVETGWALLRGAGGGGVAVCARCLRVYEDDVTSPAGSVKEE